MLKQFSVYITIAFLSSCATQQGNIQQDTAVVYNRAVDDAAVAEQTEISDRLFAINSAN